ncbi:lysine-sensitive aspartokinase 3 [Gayadomonas joobiniege]|uniref:lysine-sensitive aspartokinase 3 n=1 Tax=Gayadomonas joobiniege TaxID=1234606 RepID=UPI0003781D4F|nr:lysine-sensitive aspartokinase 3 [Gayadomonas joobiniege]
MKQLTLAKFGGTSVADHQAIMRCSKIIQADNNIRIVCVSAQSGVTNKLVALSKADLSTSQRQVLLQEIKTTEYQILTELGKPASLQSELDALLADLEHLVSGLDSQPSMQIKDELQAFGERMSSLLVAAIFQSQGIDAVNFDIRTVLKTDDHYGRAEPQIDQIKTLAETQLLPLIQNKVVVTQGFIGSDQNGLTTTLGRGGSDYSAALIAEACAADVLQIWTDVSGIYTTDPRLTQDAKPIAELSFDEAAEMATFGAKILHPATLIPAIRQGTAVFVGNSRAPQEGGTWIRKKVTNKPAYRAIALRREQVLVTLKSPGMLHASGFLARVFAILAEHKISVDLITTSEISVALTIDNPANSTQQGIAPVVLQKLAEFCEVSVEEGLSLIAVIGNHLKDDSNAGGNVFAELKNCKVRMICQGASQHNVCLLTAGDQAEALVAHLHSALIE